VAKGEKDELFTFNSKQFMHFLEQVAMRILLDIIHKSNECFE
jgi:hypothetical protein